MAADERQVFRINRKRRQQRSFIASALRRDHDIPFAGFLDRQFIAFDAPINFVERRLLDGWRADGDVNTHPLCKIGDRAAPWARSPNTVLRAREHRFYTDLDRTFARGDALEHGPATAA